MNTPVNSTWGMGYSFKRANAARRYKGGRAGGFTARAVIVGVDAGGEMTVINMKSIPPPVYLLHYHTTTHTFVTIIIYFTNHGITSPGRPTPAYGRRSSRLRVGKSINSRKPKGV